MFLESNCWYLIRIFISPNPEWAKWIAVFNPGSYFIEEIKMAVLKGSNLADIKNQILAMCGFAIALIHEQFSAIRKEVDENPFMVS